MNNSLSTKNCNDSLCKCIGTFNVFYYNQYPPFRAPRAEAMGSWHQKAKGVGWGGVGACVSCMRVVFDSWSASHVTFYKNSMSSRR